MKSVIEEYRETVENLEQIELEIESYQEFLGAVQTSYDSCTAGCNEKPGEGRFLNPIYIRKNYRDENIRQDQRINSILEGEKVLSTEVRELTAYCRDIIAEKRDRRQDLIDDQVRLEKEIGLRRHPKKSHDE